MNFIILDDDQLTYHNPLNPEELVALQRLLRSANCFVPSFVDADPYLVETYIVQYAYHRTETRLLLDRNIYSQALALAKGARVTPESRFAAGVMAFASCANIEVEPNIALYEGAASCAKKAWKRDLQVFHGADRIHPVNWAALSLGRIERFDQSIPAIRFRLKEEVPFDPSHKLRSYDFVYPIALKMALLKSAGGSCEKRMSEFLDWMYRSWRFSAPATFMAMLALSQDPPKRMFKSIGSPDRQKALKGVSNMAWDLVYMTTWYEHMKNQIRENLLLVFCSRYQVLIQVLHMLKESLLNHEGDLFERFGFGNEVRNRYQSYTSTLESPERAATRFQDNFEEYKLALISDLEGRFLNLCQ